MRHGAKIEWTVPFVFQMPVNFKEVAMYFPDDQGLLLDADQRSLYESGMQENGRWY